MKTKKAISVFLVMVMIFSMLAATVATEAEAYTNSSLVTYTNISPNKTSPRNHTIDTITIHCMVGQLTAKRCCDLFIPTSKAASANYAVGTDGSIGLSVEEKDRSWCSSDAANDDRAITIEVASNKTYPYAVTTSAYNALLNLVTDVCQRNGIRQLVLSTSKDDRVNHHNGCNMTVHRDFLSTDCPGEYLYSRMGQIAAEVNSRLGSGSLTPTNPITTLSAGTQLNLSSVALYINSETTTISSYKTGTYYVWSGDAINNRIRITNSPSNVGVL